MIKLLNYLTLVLSAILVILVLLQSKGGGLGGAFGGDSAYQTRRGVEKGIFIVTVVLAVLFVGLILASLFLQK